MRTVELPRELWTAIAEHDEPNVLELHQRSTQLTRAGHPLQDAYRNHSAWRAHAPEDLVGRPNAELGEAFRQRHALRTPQARRHLHKLTTQQPDEKTWEFLPKGVTQDFDLRLAHLRAHPSAGPSSGDTIDDKAVALRAMQVKMPSHYVHLVSPRLWDDEDVALAAAAKGGFCTNLVSHRLRNTPRFIRAAYKLSPENALMASQDLRQNPAFLDSLADIHPSKVLIVLAKKGATFWPTTLRRCAPELRSLLTFLKVPHVPSQEIERRLGFSLQLQRAVLGG